MSRFLREHTSLCWPLVASETTEKNFLQTCNVPELSANWEEISCSAYSPAHTNELIHTQTQSWTNKSPLPLSYLPRTQKQINYTGWLPPLIYLMKSTWRLPLLTNIQASLVHLGPNTVMGTSCLVNKHACKHKTHCALHRVSLTVFTRARFSEDMFPATKDNSSLVTQVLGLSQITVI